MGGEFAGGQPRAGRARLARRRFSLTVGQLLAASIALVLLSGGGVWLAVQQGPTRTAAEPPDMTQSSTARGANWTGSTDAAIAQLQAALVQNEKRVGSTALRIVGEKLAIIYR